MSKRSEAVKKWRSNTKQTALKSLGSKCCLCGYEKCKSALQFHHLDPSQKDFGLAQMLSSPKEWAAIVTELKKCVLLCSNCHAEVHEGIIEVPNNARRFDETLITPEEKTQNPEDKCPNCDKQKRVSQRACSVLCARKLNSKVDWAAVDLVTLISKHSYTQIGEMLGCSDSAVIKQLKKRNLYVRRIKRS